MDDYVIKRVKVGLHPFLFLKTSQSADSFKMRNPLYWPCGDRRCTMG